MLFLFVESLLQQFVFCDVVGECGALWHPWNCQLRPSIFHPPSFLLISYHREGWEEVFITLTPFYVWSHANAWRIRRYISYRWHYWAVREHFISDHFVNTQQILITLTRLAWSSNIWCHSITLNSGLEKKSLFYERNTVNPR